MQRVVKSKETNYRCAKRKYKMQKKVERNEEKDKGRSNVRLPCP